MAENYKISLGIDFNDGELKNIKKQLTNLTDNTHRVRIDIDNSRLLKQIEHAKKELKELNSAKGNQPSLTVNTQSLEKSLSRVADVIEEVRKSLGTLDDKSGMKSLLSSVNQIVTALGKVENESDSLLKSLSALSKKDFSINFDLKMGKSASQISSEQGDIKRDAISQLKQQAKALEDYLDQYYKVAQRQEGVVKLTQGTNLFSSFWEMSPNIGDTKASLKQQVSTYKQYIDLMQQAAKIKGVDLSSVTSGFSKTTNDIVEGTKKVSDGVEEAKQALKGIFGGSLDVEGLSGQLQPIIADLGEIKTALQSLSSNNSIDGLTQSFNRLSEILEKLTTNLMLAKNTLDTGFSNTAPVDSAVRTAQQTGQKIGETISKSAKQSINIDDVIDEQVLKLMNEYAIAGNKDSKAFDEIKQSLNDFRSGSGDINKVTSAISNNMKVVNDAKNDYKDLAERIKMVNASGVKVHLPDSIRQEYGDDFRAMQRQLGSGRLGNAFTLGQGMDFESFVEETNSILGQTIDLSHGAEAAFGDLVRKINSTKGGKFLTGDDLFRSGILDMGDVVANVSTSLEHIENAEEGITRASTTSANTVVQNEERKQQAYKQTSDAIQSISKKASLIRDDVDFKRVFDGDNQSAKEAQQYFQTLLAEEKAIVSVKESFDNSIGDGKALKSFTVDIQRASGEVEKLHYAMSDAEDDSRFLYQGGSVSDRNIEKQTEARIKKANDLQTKLEKIKSDYNDMGNAKPIKDSDHINTLDKQYRRVEKAIDDIRNADNTMSSSVISNAEKQKSALENMVREYRNAETLATSLRSKDINTVGSTYSSDLDVLISKMKKDGVYTSGFEKGAENLRSVLSDAVANKDKNGLVGFLNGLDKLEAGYKRASAAKKEFNQSESVGIDTSTLRSKIENLQRISPEIDKFETEINGTRVTVKSLLNDLDNIKVRGDFNVVNKRFNAFEKAAESAGIAVKELGQSASNASFTKEINQEINDFIKLQKQIENTRFEIGKLEITGDSTNQIAELKRQLEELENTYDKLMQAFLKKVSVNADIVPEDALSKLDNGITEATTNANNRLEQFKAKWADTRAELAKSIKVDINLGNFDNEMDAMRTKFNSLSDANDDLRRSFNATEDAYTVMMNAAKANTGDEVADREKLIRAEKEYAAALEKTNNLIKQQARADKIDVDALKLQDNREVFQAKIDSWLEKNSAATKKFGAELLSLRSQAEKADQVELNHLEKELVKIDKAADKAGLKMQSFGDQIKSKFKEYMAYFSVAEVFMYTEQALSSMFEQVKLIDSAMTELKKVTDETDASYDRFLTNAASRAKEIGTTIDGLVSSTADFARLGYDFVDAQGLAEVANIYAVVGDDIESVEGATESLISTLTAFKKEANGLSSSDFAMNVVDKMNEVADTYSISSGGLGEALKRSASSMETANNSLDETIALITAANEVVQDPEVVGQAFKTISMRIRGAKTELEDAGESTEGMAESTASLRQEIMALSGVDIMLNENTFKSTYQILDELSHKWENLSDIAQASIIELVAGKHRGNVMSSLMSNFDVARSALETSMNSAGSAMREHERWSQSLEAKLNSLNASWQGLSQAFLSSDFLKVALDGVVGLVDGLAKLIDTFGALPTLIGVFTGGLSLFKNKGIFTFDKDAQSIKLFSTELSNLGNTYKSVQSKINEYNSLSAKQQADFANNIGKSNIGLSKYFSNLNGAKASMGGYITSLVGAKVATFALQAATVALNTALTMGISILISAAIKAFDEWYVSADELADKVDDVTSKYKEQHKALTDIKADYDTSNESSMISKYAKLSKGVDGLGKNVSLTADEYSEYQSIVSTIADQIPSLVSGYDSQGNAILSCAGNVDQLTAAYEKLIHAQNNEILTKAGNIDEDFSNVIKDSEHNTKGWFGWNWTKELDLGSAKLSSDAAEIYKNILNAEDAVSEFKKAVTADEYGSETFLEGLDVKALSDLLETAGFEKEGNWLSGESSQAHVERAFKENKAVVKKVLDQYYADLEKEIEGKKSLAQAALSEAFDLSDSMYHGMSDTMKNIAQQVVNGFDFEFFADLDKKGIGVEDYVNSILNQLNSLSDSDETSIEAAFNLKTQFNGGEISYGEYVGGLESVGDLVDNLVSNGVLDQEIGTQIKLSLGLDEEGFVENYQTLLNRLTETSDKKIASGNIIGLDLSEAESLLDSLSSEELSVMTQILPEIDANATREQIEAAINREMVLQGLTFDLNLEVEAAGIESLNTALSESVTASGLSSDSISALKSRYADLESQGYDLSSMFEETSHGIHLNRNELSKLENELSKQKLAEVDADLNEMKAAYDELGEAIKNCDDPLKKSELYNERQSLAQKISECATLASQYKGLTSAYNDWLAAESAGNERDMYENVITGFETVNDELSRGWADDGTIKFLEMLTGRTDLAGKSGKELKEVYDGLDKKIKNTTHSIKDFFTVDDEGNSTSKGVYNFLDAVGQLEEEAFGGKDIVKRDGKGNVIGFDFELAGGDEAIAEALGVSEELVQIMVRAADDAGFVVSMDGTYKQLADLQNEAKAAANYLKEIGKTDFDFDFNTSSVSNLKDQLKEAKEILKDKSFWNADGTFNFDAKGATEAMQVVSTLQAKIDNLTKEQYGIGLTVEDKEFEEPLENLQNYGKKVATLNQLELNPKANAEEIKELNGELDDIAEYFANLDGETKVKLGFEASDGIEEVKSKIESGEVKIPTTLDIQTNMDKNLSDLRDLALLNSGLLNPDQEEAIKIRLGIEVEAGEIDDSKLQEDIKNGVHDNSAYWSENKPKVTTKSDVEIKAGEVDTSNVDETIKNEVKTGAEGQKNYRIGVSPDVKIDPEVDTSGAEEKIKEKTSEAVKNQSSKTEKVEKEVELEFKIGDYIDNLSEFEDVAKRINELDEDISATVTANIEGNIFGTEDISNLAEFAEGAKAIQDVKSSDVSVEVDYDSNLNQVEDLDKLLEFAKGAKELEGVKSSDVSVEAELQCEFNGGNLDSLAKFADSASKLEGVKSSDVSVEVNLDGNLSEWKGSLEDIGTFAKNAKELDGVKDANVSIKVNLESEFNETDFDDLTEFVTNAKELQGVKDSEVSVSANLEGNLSENANIDKLQAFAEGAGLLKDVKTKEVEITTNLYGNLVENPNLYNLETFADGVEKLQDVKGKEVEVTANLYGNLIDNPNLYSLDDFADGVEKLQDSESKKVEVTANLYGNLIQNPNLYSLDDFAEGAETLQDSESKKVEITTNLFGNLVGNPNLYNLENFAEGAEELQDVEGKKVEVTANLYGNLTNNPNLYSLDDFADVASELQDVDGKKVEITANLYGNLTQNPNLYSLDDFADGAKDLQGVESKKVEITANLFGNLVGNPNLYSLEAFADGAKELQGIESKNVRIDANLYGNLIGNGNLSNLGTFADRAKELQGIGNVNVSVKANVDATSINTATVLLTKVASSGLFKDYNATVNVKAVVNEIDDSKVQGYKAPPKNGKVTYSVDSSKVDAWKAPTKNGTVNYSAEVEALTNAQKHKSGTITYKANIVGLGPAAGTAHASGSANASGSTGRSFARGDWGIKGNGVALGGELGPEIVVRQGKFFTIGDEGAEFFRYRKNDIVFNATQTEALFKYGGLKGANPRGKMLASGSAFADGNAFSKGSGGGFWTNTSTGESYGSKDSSSNKDFEEVIDWIETILDRVERSIDKFDQQANNIYKSWSSRNKALQNQISEVNKEISLQQQAYSEYMGAADGVGLSSSWKKKVQNGTIDINTVKDEVLAEKIKDYQKW